ncbi:MAG: hypothetical protein AB1508_19015 [Pseudomonadota bacterium]
MDKIQYNNLSTTGPSPAIWADCPVLDMALDPRIGYHVFDDFLSWPLIGTQTTQIAHDKYKVFNTGSGVVTQVSAVNSVETSGGILSITLDTDNDSGSIAQAYPSFLLTGSATTSAKLWFEARVAVNTIATNTLGFMVGLAEVEQWTLATGVPFNGGDGITNSASFIGFRKTEDGLGSIDSVYSDRATSFTNIGAGQASCTANTFVKLGFRYDPSLLADCVSFYCDGVKMATTFARSSVTGTTNLKANALGLIAAVIADSGGTSGAFYMDWWRVAQLR